MNTQVIPLVAVRYAIWWAALYGGIRYESGLTLPQHVDAISQKEAHYVGHLRFRPYRPKL